MQSVNRDGFIVHLAIIWKIKNGRGISPQLLRIYRQHRTKPACRLCAASADDFSVISHRNSLQYASIPASFLCNLTKKLLAHLPHNLCVVSPCNCKRPLHQKDSGVCVFQPHRYGIDPGGTSHGSQAGAPGAGTDVSFGSGRAVCGSSVPRRARKTGLCAEYVPEGRTTRQCGCGKFLQLP